MPAIYATGTVDLTNGSTAVVGTGTAWEIALVTGGILAAEAEGNALPIASVEDDTHLTAAIEWRGLTGTYAYAIVLETAEAVQAARINARLAELLTRLANAGTLGADPGILLNWDAGTSDANPGSGKIRANNASLASATKLFVSKTNRAGSDISALLATLDDSSSTVKGQINLLDPLTEEQATFNVTALTDASGYVKLDVAVHAGADSFDAGGASSLQFARTGDAGGVTSVNGSTGVVVLAIKDIGPGAEQDIASNTTTDLTAAPAFRYRITGTNAITGITLGNNKWALLRFAAALTLTYNATSLILPTAASIITEAGDTALIVSDGSGNIRVVGYWRASGEPLTLGAKVREKLTADRTYYVRSDGSNSNTGLVNSSGGAFLTLNKARDALLALDLNGFTVTIKMGNTATLTAGLSFITPPVGGPVILEGDTSTPANTIVSVTSGNAVEVKCNMQLSVKHVELRTTTSGNGIHAEGPGARIAILAGVRFGAAADWQAQAKNGGYISNAGAAYNVTGAAKGHYSALRNGVIDIVGALTVTVSGTPAMSVAFAQATEGGGLNATSVTFSGSATGVRYSATLNGVIQTGGGGASYFPGGTGGSTATGGQYA